MGAQPLRVTFPPQCGGCEASLGEVADLAKRAHGLRRLFFCLLKLFALLLVSIVCAPAGLAAAKAAALELVKVKPPLRLTSVSVRLDSVRQPLIRT